MVLSEPAIHALQPEALQLLEALRTGVRRPGPAVLSFVPAAQTNNALLRMPLLRPGRDAS